jgi:hypothetical protein
MNSQEKRKQNVAAGLSKIQPPVILGLTGFRRQYLFRQRCFLPTTHINDRSVLDYLLDDTFPQLCFSQKNNVESLDILNYVRQAGGQYILDLVKMSRSENFTRLFHEDFAKKWDEDTARKKYGRANVIRFFIDIENERFLAEFSKLKNANIVNIGVDSIPNMFLYELGLNNDEKKPVWEEWDFSKIVKHKSPDIYKAFERYGHKKYTLLGFGLWKLYKENPRILKDRNTADLLLAGNKLLDSIVREEIPKIDSFSIERQIAIFEAEQEILESVPEGGSIYAPTETKTFIKQLKSRIPSLIKSKYLDNPEQVNHVETFNSGERKNIKKYFEKLEQYIVNIEDFNEYHETRTYREKVMFLYQWIGIIRKNFSERELEIIYGLIGRLGLPVSFDEPVKNKDNGESFILYDITKDDRNVSADERLSGEALFTGVFKQEFDETQMKKFLECIPQHFSEYPPKYDEAGNFNMVYYSKQQLYKTFCITAGIEEEQEIWEMFLEMIQEVIDNINRIRKELRGRP